MVPCTMTIRLLDGIDRVLDTGEGQTVEINDSFGRIPGRWPRDALSSRHQSLSEGDAANCG